MLYPFMTLEDQTEIVHSEAYFEDGKEKVRVEIEKPIEGGFCSAECILPDYTWSNIQGFTKKEIDDLQNIVASLAHVIIRLAREGGFDHASGF
jgi:hypothetical protein